MTAENAAPAEPEEPDPETDTDARAEAGADTGAEGGAPDGQDAEGPLAPLDLPFDAATVERLVEAVLFASAEPMTPGEIAARLPDAAAEPAMIEAALAALEAGYAGRGVRLVRAGGARAFRTATDLAPLLARPRVEQKPMSRAGIETLAIIAYHQPVTRAEIEEIRGVGVSRGTLDFLLELGWVKLGPRRETPGRPATFVTTTAFLDHFGLASARDLPGLKELRAAGLLDPLPEGGTAAGAAGDLLAGGDEAGEADDSDDAGDRDDAPGDGTSG